MELEQPVLLIEQNTAGVHVRIWRYEDGRIMLERMTPNGKGIAVSCPTFDKALALWCQIEAGYGHPEEAEE